MSSTIQQLTSQAAAQRKATSARMQAKFEAVLNGTAPSEAKPKASAGTATSLPKESADIGNSARQGAVDHGSQMKDFAKMRSQLKAGGGSSGHRAQGQRVLQRTLNLINSPTSGTGGGF